MTIPKLVAGFGIEPTHLSVPDFDSGSSTDHLDSASTFESNPDERVIFEIDDSSYVCERFVQKANWKQRQIKAYFAPCECKKEGLDFRQAPARRTTEESTLALRELEAVQVTVFTKLF